MGELYARRVQGVARPRVAVLANGEEESKGTDLTRLAATALRRANIDFRGYAEGRDLLSGEFDVIATDGFTGNVALKTMEGTARAVGTFLKGALHSSWWARLGGLLARPALTEMKRRIDWRTVGGAPLVGVAGVGFVAHGASDAVAIENACRRAWATAGTHFTDEIAEAVAPATSLLAQAEGNPPPTEPPAPRSPAQADA